MDNANEQPYYPSIYHPVLGYRFQQPEQTLNLHSNDQIPIPSIESSNNTLSADEVRLPIHEMIKSSEGAYKGWVRSIEEYHETKRQYHAMHDHYQDPSSYGDFPSNPEHQRELVETMFDAALNVSRTYEHARNSNVQGILNKKYNDLEYELVFWQLLESIYDSQRGHCRLPNHLDRGKPHYEEYRSFGERFDAVINALRSSKGIVGRLFVDTMFADRLAWRPKSELGRITKHATWMYQRASTGIASMEGSTAGNPPQRSTSARRKSALKKGKLRSTEHETLSANQMDMQNTQTFSDG
ncbi:uncharacterized protein F4807DRAFT_456913 [Annulohypoxylon truncatum]|uniref:uncharacterized protein n=1 Tax=Annulohypoxylon truncatum TaxID=327061 RepID=UPI0020076BDC|nr:uncharacterized protein F4807DRAFT_456913 [Annulohypoxylon truncatum]KAI1213569.1 hypothetical protein F4807DRAFT_456913 [Annulohypoxylon truncatum]